MAIRVEIDGRIVEGNPETFEITAYQTRFYRVAMSDPDAYDGKRTLVPDPYKSLEDVNSDPDVHGEFESALRLRESEEYVAQLSKESRTGDNMVYHAGGGIATPPPDAREQ